MSWLDALKAQVLERLRNASAPADAEAPAPADPAATAGAFDGVVAMLREKGLGELGRMFDAGGLKDVFASWVGKGSNLPVSAEQLREVLGGGTLEGLAKKLGLPEGQVSALLAHVLPGVVDGMTPDGTLPEPPAEEPAEGTSAPASF